MKKILLALLLTGLCSLPALGQQYFQNTMFPYTQYGYNPAAAGATRVGMDQGSMLTLMGRLQWLGFEGGPETSYLSYETGLPANAGYVGGLVVFDRAGAITTGTVTASYAYEFELGADNNFLRIGASGGIKQWRLDPTNFQARDDNDPILPEGITSVAVPALSTGVYFTGNYPDNDLKYYGGISIQNLLEPSFDNALRAVGSGTEDVRTFILSGGYNFKLDADRMRLMPSIMMINDFALTAPQVSTGLLWSYKPIAIGVNYRFFGESVGATAGFHITDDLFVGYSYDYPTTTLNASSDVNTHEVILTYRLGSSRSTVGGEKQDIFKDAGEN